MASKRPASEAFDNGGGDVQPSKRIATPQAHRGSSTSRPLTIPVPTPSGSPISKPTLCTVYQSPLSASPSAAQVPRRQYTAIQDSDVICIYVGPQKKCFLWHRTLVCSESSLLANSLRQAALDHRTPSPSPCHQIPVLSFPNETEECFQYATQWLYERPIDFSNPSLTLTTQIYKFAVRLGIEDMQNYLIDMLRRTMPSIGRTKIEGSLLRLMECNNTGERGLRGFLLDITAKRIQMNKEEFISTHERSDLTRQLFQHQELARDLFMVILRDDDPDTMSDVSDGCKYHKHIDGRACLNTSKDSNTTMIKPSKA